MATFKFIRSNMLDSRADRIKFDNLPKNAICKEYGMDPETYEVRNPRTEYDRKCPVEVCDVYAGVKGCNPTNIGTLYYKAPLWPGGPSNRI